MEPFLRKRVRPKPQKLGEDPDLDAAVAAFKALDTDLAVDEAPPVQDLSVGMGNASAYVAPTEVKVARVPAAGDSPKVEFGMADVPRELPEGNPMRETAEMKVLRRPPSGDDEPTRRREGRTPQEGRTVGGGTARLPVVKVEAASAQVVPVELPSVYARPRGPGSDPATPTGRGRSKGVVLAAVLFGVAVFIVFRVATTRPDGTQERPAASGVATTTLGSPSAPITAPTAAAPPASVALPPSIPPTGTAAGPDTPGANTSAPAGAPTAPSGVRAPPGKRRPVDEPPAAAVTPPPVVTAVPAAPPTTAPPVPPTTPPPQPAAAPKPPASGTPFDKPNYD